MGLYVDNQEVAKVLGYDYDDPHIMEQIQLILEYVEPQVENYCHTVLAPSSGAKTFSGTGNYLLQSSLFIRNVTSGHYLDEDGEEVGEIDMSGVYLGPDNARLGVYRYIGRRKSHGFWPEGEQNIKLVGDWGFAETPGPVKAAIGMAVKTMFDSRDYNEFLKYESNLSRNIQFKDSPDILPTPAKKLLNYYRIMPIAFPGG